MAGALGIRLKTGHGGGGVVQNNHGNFGLVKDGVDHGRDAGMEEGGITQMTDHRVALASGQTIGDAETAAHTGGGIIGI